MGTEGSDGKTPGRRPGRRSSRGTAAGAVWGRRQSSCGNSSVGGRGSFSHQASPFKADRYVSCLPEGPTGLCQLFSVKGDQPTPRAGGHTAASKCGNGQAGRGGCPEPGRGAPEAGGGQSRGKPSAAADTPCGVVPGTAGWRRRGSPSSPRPGRRSENSTRGRVREPRPGRTSGMSVWGRPCDASETRCAADSHTRPHLPGEAVGKKPTETETTALWAGVTGVLKDGFPVYLLEFSRGHVSLSPARTGSQECVSPLEGVRVVFVSAGCCHK